MNRRLVRISVRAVIVDDGKLLLALHHHPERSQPTFWCFPGGGVEPGEDLKTGLQREVMEETGLDVEVLEPVYLQDFLDRNMFDVFLRARVRGGNLLLGEDPEPGANHLVDVQWIPVGELGKIVVLPAELAELISRSRKLPHIPMQLVSRD